MFHSLLSRAASVRIRSAIRRASAGTQGPRVHAYHVTGWHSTQDTR